MSDIIQLLPDSVANQIAAGEVIQRPASVIKELVENAVDAGAKHIDVAVVDAGRTSIQVIDDGKGMSETDARLAFERHATSKIRKADDLFDLHTMGFRGEALPSIAAVAQVELKTRQQGEDIGTHLSIAGGKVTGQEPCACPEGSNFMVENLFFNVPARRKFLKSNNTELNNILTAFHGTAQPAGLWLAPAHRRCLWQPSQPGPPAREGGDLALWHPWLCGQAGVGKEKECPSVFLCQWPLYAPSLFCQGGDVGF